MLGLDGREVWLGAEVVPRVDDVKDSRTGGVKVEVSGSKEVESSDAVAETEQSEPEQEEFLEAGNCEVAGSEEMEARDVFAPLPQRPPNDP